MKAYLANTKNYELRVWRKEWKNATKRRTRVWKKMYRTIMNRETKKIISEET